MSFIAVGQYLINPQQIIFVQRYETRLAITLVGLEDRLVFDGDDALKLLEALLSFGRSK